MTFGLLSVAASFNIEFVEMFKLCLHWGAKSVKITNHGMKLIK